MTIDENKYWLTQFRLDGGGVQRIIVSAATASEGRTRATMMMEGCSAKWLSTRQCAGPEDERRPSS